MASPPFSYADSLSGLTPPKGWDAADAVRDGWTEEELTAFIRETAVTWTPPAPRKDSAKAKPGAQAAPAAADDWLLSLLRNGTGKIRSGATKNWALFLEHHPDLLGIFAFDAFKMRVMLMRMPPWDPAKAHWQPRILQDRDYSEAVMWLEQNDLTPAVATIAPVIQTVAEHHRFDRLTDYLEGLAWDRKPRLHDWLTYYMGIEDTPYARTVGTRWLISSVARGLQPGCKVDTMPIFEGPQGARKSTAVRVLYGDDFFTDELSDIGSKDAMMEMQGIWGLEVAEMHRFNASETSAVKKFLRKQTDRFRPPYGRTVIEAPRRVCLCGTINPDGNPYLKDTTGGRSFWPLAVGRIDIEAIAADRDQLWAEAVTLYKAKTPWWVQEEEQEAVTIEQEKRTDVDVWIETIVPSLRGRRSVTQLDIFKTLGISAKDADWRHAGRIGRIMKKLGWTASRDRRNGEDRVVFLNPAFDGSGVDEEEGVF